MCRQRLLRGVASLEVAGGGVVTNVEPAHIGYMGSEEAIADEKACLFAGMREGAVAVLNRDNRHYERLARHARNFGRRPPGGRGR